MLLALSVVLVAINLRPAVAGVGSVLPELRAGLPLSGAGTAVLTTLPVMCFGLLATVAPRLARRYGIEPMLVAVMATRAVGALVRVLDGPPVLFVGTIVAGGAIAIGNVLLPPLIKRDFPDRSGLMMGVYTMSVSGAAAVAAGIAVPYLWVALIGAGQGGCFALGLNLFLLRTESVADTARASAMAQSIGYILCAFGPLLVGLLHEATGSWTAPLVLLLALLGPQLVCGALAGRARKMHL